MSFNFNLIPSSDSIQIKIKNLESNEQLRVDNADFLYEDSYKIIQNSKVFNISLLHEKDKYELNSLLKMGNNYLARIIKTSKNSSELLIKFFNGECDHMGPIEIGIDEKIIKTADKNFNFNDIYSDLESNLNYLHNNKLYFFVSFGQSSDFDNFTIIGNGFKIPVGKKNLDGKDIFFASRLISIKHKHKDKSIKLIEGGIKILDYTETGEIKHAAKGALQKLEESSNSYLDKWDEYGEQEGEILLSDCREIGKIKYNSFEVREKGIKFFLREKTPPTLRIGDQLKFTKRPPSYIQNKEMTYKEWETSHVEIKEEVKTTNKKDAPIYKESGEKIAKVDDEEPSMDSFNTNSHKILDLSSNSITISMRKTPHKEKYKEYFFVFSPIGDLAQIKRRHRARRMTQESEGANPQLGLIINENGLLIGNKRTEKIKPLTSFVRKKIFKYDPTQKQIQAIDIALNTPDIALIQGPPGTGKTTVITAIIERLNELYDKSDTIKGKILVSCLQHDAVENILQRLTVNSLPSLKFGRRSDSDDYSENSIDRKIRNWCDEVAEKVRLKNPKLKQSEIQIKLFESFSIYISQPSNDNAVQLLEKIISIKSDKIGEEIILKAKMMKNEISMSEIINIDNKLQNIRALRVTEEGFQDDGPKKATNVFFGCKTDLKEGQKKILNTAISWDKNSPLSFLKELRLLKMDLLKQFTPKPFYKKNKPRKDILELIGDVSKKLKNNFMDKEGVLAEFLNELEENPDQVEKTLSEYNIVYASTVQQSQGKDIRKAKNISNPEDEMVYDYVIIDEAARTSPRDLLIPMVQGRKIILVGDHRQLPHIINESIIKKLESEKEEENTDNLETDYIKNSMFRYLFSRIKEIEKADSIKRSVTLDAQFRTHPLLGEFVSKQFYPLKEQFKSPLPEKKFLCNLPIVNNKVAIWVDIPSEKGIEKRSKSMSLNRKIEAVKIAEILNEWIKSENSKKLTFGVISFYKSQINMIKAELAKYGITKRSSNGNYTITDKYKNMINTHNDEEKLRINTVDSFQGMEFDIVILSAVRSKVAAQIDDQLKLSNNINLTCRSIYGHLMSSNRLCVSMSRQIKKLIVVGDSSLFKREIAKDKVPGLYNFYQLCEDNENGMVLYE